MPDNLPDGALGAGNQQPRGAGTERIRKDVITAVVASGAVVTFLPFALARWSDPAFGAWQIVMLTTLTNVGTSLLLAVAIFLLQRNFTRDVRGAIIETTKDEVASQTQTLREETAQLRTQLEDLTREFSERTSDRDQEALAAATRARAAVTFDGIAELFELAADAGALWFGSVTIPAGSGLDAPRIQVQWADLSQVRRGGNVFDNYRDEMSPSIHLSYQRPIDERGPWTPAETRWYPRQPLAEAWDALAEAMVAGGSGARARNLDPAIAITNLIDALEAAINGRRHVAGSWMTGALDEWVAAGWAITEFGLESRDHDSIDAHEFPEHNATVLRKGLGEDRQLEFNPEPPEDVDPALWRKVLAAASQVHYRTRSVGAIAAVAGPVPYNSRSTPRNDPGWPPAYQPV